VDSIFGPRTEVAVLKYQKETGLSVDGIVGEETLNSLLLHIFPLKKGLLTNEEPLFVDVSE
jgi:murein L,D-transpeptidase YcbB/YkuD